MAYDRYDTRDAPRGERSRPRDERFESRGRDERLESRGRDERRFPSREDEDRGFFERAGDEIASWFGDDDAEQRRREDQRMMERERGWGSDYRRDEERGRFFGRDEDRERERGSFRDRDEDRGRFWRERTWDRGDFERDEGRSRPSGWGSRERGSGRDRDFEREQRERERGYRPITGDYSRSEQFFAASGAPRGGFGRGEDDRSGFAGSSEREREFDPHYHSWRQRHMSELDRDYDEYRRENQSRFEDDFSSWRERRQQKRGLLGQIREHMDVVGNDDEHVGKVDRVAGDRIILAKSDSESGGAPHSLSCSEIDRVEGDRVILNCSATEARVRWRDESRNRALFEREDQGEMGPRILDRSFEGTYR